LEYLTSEPTHPKAAIAAFVAHTQWQTPPNADITTIVVAGHMSSNVPPYRVDLIVAAAVGHSVFSFTGSILDVDGHCDGSHGYPPRKRKH
jgi:hypothetical protein